MYFFLMMISRIRPITSPESICSLMHLIESAISDNGINSSASMGWILIVSISEEVWLFLILHP